MAVAGDPYAILGVDRTASAHELKAAHRALVRRHHPDLQPPQERAEATRRVQDINVAFGMLRDPEHRARTDQLLTSAERGRDWDALVTDAGRWAGRWWRRNRGTIRKAGRTGRRAMIGAVGRAMWLIASVIGAVAGFALSSIAGRLVVPKPLFATLAGVLLGLLLGSEYGAGRARRLAGETPSTVILRVLSAAWVVAVAIGLFVDVSMQR